MVLLYLYSIKIRYDSYMQWAHCLMVSIVSEATGDRLKAVNYFRKKPDRRFRLSSKYASVLSQGNDPRSLFFSLKLGDKIVTVLYYRNRSTIQRDKLNNSKTSQVSQ